MCPNAYDDVEYPYASVNLLTLSLFDFLFQWRKPTLYTKVKKTIDFCKKDPFKSVCRLKNKMSSEYEPKMKVPIFANLIYYRIAIVENIQTQYFYNIISNCMRVFSTLTTRFASFANINALFCYIL